MTTLLSWRSGDGESRRCDDKCHSAVGPICDCLCGGRYHGAALAGDLGERVDRFGEEVFKQAKFKWPEVQLGGEDDEESALISEPKKVRTLWEIPAKRAKRW